MLLYESYTDGRLLVLLKDNDESAFEEIYRRYWKLLFSVAANKLENLSDAEEAVQDIFVDLWRRRAELCITYSLKAFLAGAIRFKVFTIMANNRRQRMRASEQREPAGNNHLVPVDMLELKELQERLSTVAARLPERCRLVYQLSRDAGYTNKQIAERLQISEKTVETHMTRALRFLRSALHSAISLF